jgi:ankyrin repeat protein
LLEAVDVNSPLIVDMLIKAGANLDLEDIKGTTPLLDATFQIGKMHHNQD